MIANDCLSMIAHVFFQSPLCTERFAAYSTLERLFGGVGNLVRVAVAFVGERAAKRSARRHTCSDMNGRTPARSRSNARTAPRRLPTRAAVAIMLFRTTIVASGRISVMCVAKRLQNLS